MLSMLIICKLNSDFTYSWFSSVISPSWKQPGLNASSALAVNFAFLTHVWKLINLENQTYGCYWCFHFLISQLLPCGKLIYVQSVIYFFFCHKDDSEVLGKHKSFICRPAICYKFGLSACFMFFISYLTSSVVSVTWEKPKKIVLSNFSSILYHHS